MSNTIHKDLKWRHIKALYQIYKQGFTRNKISTLPYIKYLIRNGYLKFRIGKSDVLEQGLGFKEEYEKEHLKDYQHYEIFLSENDVLLDQSNYSENDIRTLIFIKEQKEQILKDKYSRKKFSAVFFKDEDSKHLENNPGLEKAVLQILDLSEFPLKDPKNHQYKFVIDCPSPRGIILCENIDFLLHYWIARENSIELWFAGGNNIEKLDHLPPITLPIYYSCDWDYDGLKIYERIKQKIPQIQLLYPSAADKAKTIYTGNHKSDWLYQKDFSGLNTKLYSQQAFSLINSLILKKEWIEEETNDLQTLINNLTF